MARQLIIDGQILQTSAWYRGMGKYTAQVLQELSKCAPVDLQLAVLFNDSLDTDKERFETLEFLCPRIKQVRRKLPVTADKSATPKTYKASVEQVINEELPGHDNYFMITSPFFFDFFAEFPDNCHKLMLFYDLTPLLFWKDLGGYFPPDLYMERFQKVLEAERIFSISETTRQDLLRVFGLPPEQVLNINGGFTKISESPKKPKSFDVPEKFILFPTGDLPHKNNEVAVEGYAAYLKANKNGPPLLITSHFLDTSKDTLRAISENIVFTNNVTDEELEWLFGNASAILFASKYEGLGMPILDAVANRQPVVTSRIPVFEEMSKDAFYYFSPDDADELAGALEQAVAKKAFVSKTKHYPAIMEKYTWPNTARAVIQGIEQYKYKPHIKQGKQRLAVVCISPGMASHIGRLAEPLHFSLSQYFDVHYYFDANGAYFREMERPTFLDYLNGSSFDITKFTRRTSKDYDSTLYLLDDVAFPSRVGQRAVVLPGFAVANFDANLAVEKQVSMFKELALEGQKAILPAPKSYNDYQAVAKRLHKEISRKQLNSSKGAGSGII